MFNFIFGIPDSVDTLAFNMLNTNDYEVVDVTLSGGVIGSLRKVNGVWEFNTVTPIQVKKMEDITHDINIFLSGLEV